MHDVQISQARGEYAVDCLPCRWHRAVRYGDRHVALTGRDAYDRILGLAADHRESP
jgi:hypothetical protein